MHTGAGDRLFRKCRTSVTFTFTSDLVIRHIVVYHSSTSTCKPNFIQIEKLFCVQTDGGTDVGQTLRPALLGRLSTVTYSPPIYKGKIKQTNTSAVPSASKSGSSPRSVKVGRWSE